MTEDIYSDSEKFGPAWLYIDRINFPEQRKLKVATLLPGDDALNSAKATLMIAEPNEHDVILYAFAKIIPLHTDMLKRGPGGNYDRTGEAMENLAIIQLYLERFKRPFSDLMTVMSGSRKDAVILQVIGQGKQLDTLRVPVAA